MPKRGLGKGLSALIPSIEDARDRIVEIAVDDIKPNPRQPRQRFDERSIGELAMSIKEHGLIQPIIVRRVDEGYELVAGERRLRGAKAAGVERIPAIIRDSNDRKSLEIALIENLQREDLNAIEEAEAYRRLTEEFGLTQEALGSRAGKSRSAITNSLRLLRLTDSIKGLIQLGALTAGHARAILSVEDEGEQLRLAERIVSGGLSVRQAEGIARTWNTPSAKRAPRIERKEMAQEIGRNLGARVQVKVADTGKGRIEVHFGSLDELERLRRLLALGVVQPDGTDDRGKADPIL